jgi:hypothetical protein
MHERELKAHIAALLIAARQVVEGYGNASVRDQKEAIDRLRRVVKNVERRVATSAETVCRGEQSPGSKLDASGPSTVRTSARQH